MTRMDSRFEFQTAKNETPSPSCMDGPLSARLFWCFGKRIGERSCIRPRDAAGGRVYGRPPVGKAFLVFRQTDRGAVMYTASRCGRWPRALMENADRIPIISARCYAR